MHCLATISAVNPSGIAGRLGHRDFSIRPQGTSTMPGRRSPTRGSAIVVLMLTFAVTWSQSGGLSFAKDDPAPYPVRASDGAGMGVSIELDLFSGRPNPSWVPTADVQRRLAVLIDEARQSASPAAATAPPLGFRGFVVSLSDDGQSRRYSVLAGTVVGGGERFVDVDQAIETLMRESMPDALRAEYLTLIR